MLETTKYGFKTIPCSELVVQSVRAMAQILCLGKLHGFKSRPLTDTFIRTYHSVLFYSPRTPITDVYGQILGRKDSVQPRFPPLNLPHTKPLVYLFNIPHRKFWSNHFLSRLLRNFRLKLSFRHSGNIQQPLSTDQLNFELSEVTDQIFIRYIYWKDTSVKILT